jgi:gliding motility-associated-like protein
MKKLITLSLLLFSFFQSAKAQLTTSSQPANFSTANQGMFGPNSTFNLNFEVPIFNVPWNQTFADSSISSTFVGDYGFAISGGTSGHFGAKFYSRNWSTGDISVNYPVNINLRYPSNNTFERGETITIRSDYTVDPSAQLNTTFPQAGNIGLELDFSLRFYLTPILCFVSCAQVGAFDTGNLSTTLTIFDISANQFTYACVSPSLTCTQALLPATIDAPYGLSGTFDLPNVQTTSSIGSDQCLYASGEDQYASVQLELFKLIGGLNIPYISPVLNNLSGGGCARAIGSTYNICFNYTLFTAFFEMNVINKQDFSFCPEVYTSLTFPVPVQYTVTDPNAGNSVVQGPAQSDSITFKVGNNINFTYPCNYEYMDIDPIHDISNTITNHTYDELSFNFTMEAFAVSLRLDGFGPGENNEDSNAVDSQTWSYGPLFQNTIPLGTLPAMEWFNDSWELPGFDSIIGTTFRLIPNQYLASTGATSNVDCKGENNGSFSVNITNGSAPYTYNWSDGTSNTSSATSQTNSNFEAGNQHVVIEDANGCMAYASYNITEPYEAVQVGANSIQGVSCNGNSNGQISIAVFGGTAPYSYNWSSGSGSNTINNISGGSQSVTITDSRGCSITENFEVPEPAELTATFEVQDVHCFGGADGIVEILPVGGTAPYSYSWSNGATTKITNDWSAGTHSVTISDIKGCSNSVTFTVGQPNSAISTSGSIANVNCFDGSDGSVSASTTGGTAPYSYQWADGNFNANESYTSQANNLYASDWSAIVTDANGCVETTVFTVTQPNAELLVDISPSHVSCRSGNDGLIDLTVTGGTPGYSYNWSNGQSSQDATGLIAGSYSLNVTDGNGCSFDSIIEITQPTNILEARIKKKNVTCFGDDNGEAEIIHTGGNPPYSYSWTTGENSALINQLDGGNYTGTLTDGNGCLINLPFTIVEAQGPLTIAGSKTNIDCKGNGNGAINTTITGGTQPYKYEWHDFYYAHLYNNAPNITSLSPDTYTLVVTDTNGCSTETPFTITEPVLPLSITDTLKNVSCRFGSDAFIDVSTFGGTAPYSFNWGNGQTTEDLNAITEGVYTLSITDFNGCSLTKIYTITQPESLLRIIDFEQLDVKCKNGIDGYAKVVIYGGTPEYEYAWSNGATTDTNYNLMAGSYQVVVTDSNQCSIDTTFTITEPDLLLISSIIDSVSCYSYSDGTISSTVVGGTTPYRIAFGDSTASMLSTANSLIADSLIAGQYYISVIDSNGCQFTQAVEVFQPDTLIWQINSYPVSCYKGSDGNSNLTVTGGTLPYQYLWSDSSTNEDLINATAGNYTVTISDRNNCTVDGTSTITEPDSISLKSKINGTTCIDNNDGSIEIFVRGGVGDYSYLWSNEEITQNIYNLTGGEYYLQLQDQNGCTRIDTFFINTSSIDCIDPPNAFTPDGDGYNDTWVLENIQNYEGATIQIFNKWGTLIFESDNNYEAWDGTYQGNILPSATYYYVIDLNKDSPPYTGPLTIVKKNK